MKRLPLNRLFILTVVLAALTSLFLTTRSVPLALASPAHMDNVGARNESRSPESLFDLHAPETIIPTYVGGAQHWAALMCKFSDVGAEPQPPSFFEEMFSRNSGPSLEDYWREASYGNINAVTAEAFGWFTLPNNRAHYGFSDTTAGFDVNGIIQDCIDVADATVNFAEFDAVSVMLNSPSPVAITTLFPLNYPDGALINLGALAIPSNKFNLALMAHEMGHAYGLPHSAANGQFYANPWDLMGISSGYRCSVNQDPIYSCLGQHPISKYKNDLGWLTASEVYEAPAGTTQVTLERLALPQTDNPLIVFVDAGDVYYTVEARMRAGYDAKLAGDAVIIHRNGEDLVDGDGAAPYDDAGAMWLPGETFSDEQRGIEISVDAATATGFIVTITRGDAFEPGVELASSSVSPTSAAAGERVDLEWQLIYDDGASGAAPATISVMLPAELSHVLGSVEIDGPYLTQIDSEDPLVVTVDALSLSPLTLRHAGTVDGALASSAWLTIALEAQWPDGSRQFESMVLVNGQEVFLPTVTRSP